MAISVAIRCEGLVPIPVGGGRVVAVAITVRGGRRYGFGFCAVVRFEARKVVGILPESAAAELFLFLVLADFDPPLQFLDSEVEADSRAVRRDRLRRSPARRNRARPRARRISDRDRVLREVDFALLPDFHQMMAPGFLQAVEEKIRAAEQQNFGQKACCRA